MAVGAAVGETDLKVNIDNPTVSTASTDFMNATKGAPGWENQNWEKIVRVAVTTIDALIAKHGMPSFMKLPWIPARGDMDDIAAAAAQLAS